MAGKKKPKNGSEGSQANSESAKPEPTETEQPKEEVAIEAQAKVDSTPEAKAATESPPKEKVDPEPSKEAKQETNAEKDVRVVDEILSKLELNNPDYTTEEKLEALCLVFRETIAENVKYKNASANITEQLEKNEQTKAALQNLCKALKTQIELKEEEGDLRLREEAQKRLECTQNFETVIKDLTKLVTDNTDVNQKLKQENAQMGGKMQELVASHDQAVGKYHSLKEEYGLQMKLFDAKLAKAQLEKTEVSANANEQRLELQKMLLESDAKVTMMMGRETNLKDQLELYQTQVKDMESNLGGTTSTFQNFRKEMDRLTKQLRKVERDTEEWQNKFQESQEHIQRMNKANLEREKEFQALERKLQAMEKLNRHLNEERTKRIQEHKEPQSNGDQ